MLQGVDMMTAKLTNSLRAAGVTVRQAADAIKHLLHLHAEGARSTKNLDPVKLYLEAQVRSVSNLPFFTVPHLWYVRFQSVQSCAIVNLVLLQTIACCHACCAFKQQV